MRSLAPVALTSVFLLAIVGTASAQVCRGSALLRTRRSYQAGGGVTSSSLGSGFTGSFLSGDSFAFGEIRLGRSRNNDLDGSAIVLSVTAGPEFSRGATDWIMVCPMVGVVKAFGPRHAGGSDTNVSELQTNASFTVGIVAMTRGTLRMVPAFGLGVARDEFDISYQREAGVPRQAETGSETYGVVRIDVGFVMNDRLSIVPSIVVPFRSNRAHTRVSLSAAMSLGR
jgi:hypothetical protein